MEYATAKFIHIIGILLWASSSISLGLFMIYSMHRETGSNLGNFGGVYAENIPFHNRPYSLRLTLSFFMLGTVGIFLPIMPTVPLYLLAILFLSKASKRDIVRLKKLLYNHL